MRAALARTRAALLPLALLVLAGRSSAGAPPADQLYDRAVRASAWILTEKAAGSACLIDADDRLLVTSYHVVREEDMVTVVFPQFVRGRLIDDPGYYLKNRRKLGMTGRVIYRDARRDLALVQVDRLPDSSRALALAGRPVEPNETVYRVSTGSTDDAFRLVTGTVKQVRLRSMHYPSGQDVRCRVVESDAPSIAGHSGAAVLNADGDLVAVHAAAEDETYSTSLAVEAGVVKGFLEEGRAKLEPEPAT
jgi:S1-C subfamily serine protease